MQIGGLGFINTIIAGGKNSPTTNGLDFAGLMGSFMGKGSTTQKTDSFLTGLSNQEINELKDFLKNDDVFEMNGGLELLDQITTGDSADLFSIIRDYLGLDDQSLEDMISGLQSLIPTEKEKKIETNAKFTVGKGSENINEAIPEEKESAETNALDKLLACLNQITTLPIQELPKLLNQEFKELVKVVKLYELLSKNQDGTTKNSRLTELLQQSARKLEVFVDQTKSSSRNEFLQKTFSPIQRDLETLQGSDNGQEKNVHTIKLDSTSGMVQIHQMTRPEQLMVMLDKSGKPVSTEQLIQQFNNILSKSQFSNKEGTQKLFIKLNPENLGTLRIELIQRDSTIVAKILTTTGAAKDVLESQLQGLKHAFNMQNIQVDRIEITQQFTNPQERFFQRDHQQGGQGHQHQEGQSQKDQPNDGEFNQSFEEALLNIEV